MKKMPDTRIQIFLGADMAERFYPQAFVKDVFGERGVWVRIGHDEYCKTETLAKAAIDRYLTTRAWEYPKIIQYP